MVWHRGNRTQALRWLSVGLNSTALVGVDTGEVLVLTLAALKYTTLSVVGRVVRAADAIVDMLTIVGGVRVGRVADLEAEGVAAHEAVMGSV